MAADPKTQIIKCRDDREPVIFFPDATAGAGTQRFSLKEGTACSWAETGVPFGPEKIRPRIEPWLTALLQSEHFSLLVGSGLTHALHFMTKGSGLLGMSGGAFDVFDAEITAEAKRSAEVAGREQGNLEDRIRTANELLRGLQIAAATKDKSSVDHKRITALEKALERQLEDFAKSILKGETGIALAPEGKRLEAFNYLVSFLMSFASRSGTRDRLQLFTTNYDRCIEAGADAAGLHLMDRFVGTLAPIFRSSRLDVDIHYNPPGIRGEPRYLEGVARFTKLHGSVDWVDSERTIRRIGLPFGVEDVTPYLKAPGLVGANVMRLMIYPNSSKDRETALYPYVELFRDFAAAVCRPNSTLVCFGYSFGDEHINRVIEDMLTIPSAHLVVISYSDPIGRILETYDRLGRPAQITLLIGNHLGDLKALVDYYLPKPAIDRTTFRMAELLKARMGAGESDGTTGGKKSGTAEGSAS